MIVEVPGKLRCQLFHRGGAFNPFKRWDPNVMIPSFEVIPRIGITYNRGRSLGFHIGWLIFYFELNLMFFREITYKEVEDNNENKSNNPCM